MADTAFALVLIAVLIGLVVLLNVSEHYRRAKLVCLMAGANDVGIGPTVPANYGTLLDNIYAQMIQAQPTGRIAVTTCTDLTGKTAQITAWNAAIAGIQATFEAAHPGVLLYWDAFGTNPTLSDGTHPTDQGYVDMMNHATKGLTQAVLPYLMSIQ